LYNFGDPLTELFATFIIAMDIGLKFSNVGELLHSGGEAGLNFDVSLTFFGLFALQFAVFDALY